MIINIDQNDGTQVQWIVDDSRIIPIRKYLKGVKMEDFTGAHKEKENAFFNDSSTINGSVYNLVTLESGKKYLLSDARLTEFTAYLTKKQQTEWDKNYGSDELTLMETFTQVPKHEREA